MQRHPDSDSSPPLSSKPFLKWSGGKQRLLTELFHHLPPGRRLIEPFVGAGSVFLGLSYDRYVINDANADLMAVWAALQARPQDFIERSRLLFIEANRSDESYRRIRSQFNSETDRFERATLLPYLNRFGFNGLFRVNQSGQFNVPYGRPAKVPGFPLAEMEKAAKKLGQCTLLCGGFRFAMEQATLGDVLYCDPPYLPSANGKSFTAYGSSGFSLSDHQDLLDAGLKAARRGATVVISNHDTPQAKELYRGWQLTTVSVRRSISAQATSRGMVSELIAVLPGR